MAKKYMVDLSVEEQALLTNLINCGTQRVRKIQPSPVFLKAQGGLAHQAVR